MGRKPFIVGNWKMHGTRAMLSEARAIDRAAARHHDLQVGLAAPATLLHLLDDALDLVVLGGQDCHQAADGAHTGDISGPMLRDAGATFTLVGHSERRTAYGEDNARVRAKADAALAAGLSVLVCVGEPDAVRQAGGYEAYVMEELQGSLPAGAPADRIDVAYEPLWCVGQGCVPSEAELADMHGAVRAQLVRLMGDDGQTPRILYGGSVTAANAASILRIDEVDGALVGGASLTADSFAGILHAANPDAD